MSRLANIIDVEVFNDIPAVDIPERTAFFESGIAVNDAALTALANAPGKTAEMHFWKDLNPATEQNYSNDNPADVATPLQIEQGEMIARKAFMNQGWTESDLAAELASGGNAMRRIRARVDTYWTRRWQRRIISTAVGLYLNNVADNSSDMVHDISLQDGAAATDANKFSRTAMVAGAFTLGDGFEAIGTILVHSVVAQRMIDNDDIIYVADSAGRLSIPTYLGRRVVIDDSSPVIAGTTSGFRYVSTLFGAGIIGYGEGTPEVPTEIDRVAAGGNGGGVETLWTRKTMLIHPLGHTFTSNTVSGPAAPKSPAGISPTDADLRLAANWNRTHDRKLIPLAFVITNG
jgi:hypothetical protein